MLSDAQRRFAEAVSAVIGCNPFLPERIELERRALGDRFVSAGANWNLHPSEHQHTENIHRIAERSKEVLAEASFRGADKREAPLLLDLVWFALFNDFRREFAELAAGAAPSAGDTYRRFRDAWSAHCPPCPATERAAEQLPHVFATLVQIRRAFDNIFGHLIGSAPAIIELRAGVWRSVFTHDLRRYLDATHAAMADFPTLVTGPTGSGKELVARAIGQSGYVPFDDQAGRFATPFDELFVSLNLSALSPTLIESELFGHAEGAFTGATADRVGWLEACPRHGAVFLDEIGELDQDIQVKLLRVLQDREFQRLGETETRRFHGRIIAATNRDLPTEVAAGRFRLDFYYRLCADQVETPSLAERVGSDAEELTHLVEHLLARILGREEPELAADCVLWIGQRLGGTYPWPGNVRELEQCLRSWLIRQDYRPLNLAAEPAADALESALAASELTADELFSLYCRVKHRQCGSYVETAKRLGVDRRTVKARVAGGEG